MTSQITVCPQCGKKNRVPGAATGVPRCGNCKSPLPWMAEADDATFAEVVEQASVPVLVDLWAPWCGPCHMVSPALESLAKEYAGKVKLVKVNVDTSPAIARRFEAMSIPMLLVLDNGRLVSKQVGAAPEHALRTWLDDALSKVTAGQ
jgi:thioredoxin 2